MAEEPEKIDSILAEIAASREQLGNASEELRESAQKLRKKLDVSSRVSESFKKHRPAWLGGAAIFGLLLSKLPARSKTVYVDSGTGKKVGGVAKAGAVLGMARFVFGLAKPWLGDLVAKRVVEYAQRRREGQQPPPPQG